VKGGALICVFFVAENHTKQQKSASITRYNIFGLVLTTIWDNAALRTCLTLLERELRSLSFFDVKLFAFGLAPSTQTCA